MKMKIVRAGSFASNDYCLIETQCSLRHSRKSFVCPRMQMHAKFSLKSEIPGTFLGRAFVIWRCFCFGMESVNELITFCDMLFSMHLAGLELCYLKSGLCLFCIKTSDSALKGD